MKVTVVVGPGVMISSDSGLRDVAQCGRLQREFNSDLSREIQAINIKALRKKGGKNCSHHRGYFLLHPPSEQIRGARPSIGFPAVSPPPKSPPWTE